jgi:hypothetical protein
MRKPIPVNGLAMSNTKITSAAKRLTGWGTVSHKVLKS